MNATLFVTLVQKMRVILMVLLLAGWWVTAFAQATEEPSNNEVPAAGDTSVLVREFIDDPNGEVLGDFVVGPGKTELSILPGERKVVELLITNRTGEERVFSLVTEDAAGGKDPSQAVALLGAVRGPYTLKDYLLFPQETITLAHNERVRVPVTVEVPPDAEPGGRYGSVIVTTVTQSTAQGQVNGAAPRSAVVSRIGSLFFVTVPGDVVAEGALQDFATLPPQRFFTQGPITFQLLYENSGSIHLNPYGTITVKNMLGEEVGFVELDPWFVLPNSVRAREVVWDRAFLLGRYTATAQINRGYDDIIDTKVLTVWVLPWKVLLGGFALIFLVLMLVRFVIKNFEFRRKV